jgi:hypothetical protein
MIRLHRAVMGSLVASLLAGCSPNPKPPSAEASVTSKTWGWKCVGSKDNANAICDVSIIDLIANPAQFDGRKVLVSGYVQFGLEESGIYLHKDDAVHNLWRNGVWIDLGEGVDSAKCQYSYALVEGTFKAGMSGHNAVSSGELQNVTRCEAR